MRKEHLFLCRGRKGKGKGAESGSKGLGKGAESGSEGLGKRPFSLQRTFSILT